RCSALTLNSRRLLIIRVSGRTKEMDSLEVFIPSRRLEALRVEQAWFGAGERNRTSNLRFTKPLLCRLSYASPHVNRVRIFVPHSTNRPKNLSRKVPAF